jgi:hypothetical protein
MATRTATKKARGCTTARPIASGTARGGGAGPVANTDADRAKNARRGGNAVARPNTATGFFGRCGQSTAATAGGRKPTARPTANGAARGGGDIPSC